MSEPRSAIAWVGWIGLGAVLGLMALGLTTASDRFGPDVGLIDMPALALAGGLVAAGFAFALVVPLLSRSLAAGLDADRRLIVLIVGFGVVIRLILCAGTPAFEDDWYRYLWDGAVVARGYNPYAVSPDDAQGEAYAATLQALARQSGVVIQRINHPDLKTIYPPVAQAAFALAHLIEPWSLAAWRLVLLLAEAATLGLLFALLREVGRSPLWVALYWWNPVVLKELMNSAHMEGIVTPLVLGAVLLAVRGRQLSAAAVLGLAIGAKLWPVVLAPLLLRPLWSRPGQLASACAILAGFAVVWALPLLQGGLDQSSGFVAFAHYWRTNNAMVPVLERAAAALAGADATWPLLAVRILLAAALAVAVAAIARRPVAGAADVLSRAGLTTAALYLLSPAQFPWYAIWMLPFAVFNPWRVHLAITALVPGYYASFYFDARDAYPMFTDRVLWLVWVPVWLTAGLDLWRGRIAAHPPRSVRNA